MKIAYICYLSNDRIKAKYGHYNAAGDNLSHGIVEGIELNEEKGIDVFTVMPIPMFPKSQLIFSPIGTFQVGEKSVAHYIPFVNIPVLKQLCLVFSTFFSLLKWGYKHRKDKDKIILMYNLFSFVSYPAYWVGKILGIPMVTQLADPIMAFADYKGIKKLLSIIDVRCSLSLLNKMNALLAITERLATDFVSNMPHKVFNCGIDNSKILMPIMFVPRQKHIIVYSGGLDSSYLIPLLLDAFSLLDPEYYELHISGRGKYEALVREAQATHTHIKMLGFIPVNQLVEEQKKASLLITLRNPQDPITNYCFSSKLIEYMASGTPILMTETHEAQTLGDSVRVIKELTPEGMAKAIQEACDMTAEERYSRAIKVNELLREKYTWDSVGKEFYDFLQGVLCKYNERGS